MVSGAAVTGFHRGREEPSMNKRRWGKSRVETTLERQFEEEQTLTSRYKPHNASDVKYAQMRRYRSNRRIDGPFTWELRLAGSTHSQSPTWAALEGNSGLHALAHYRPRGVFLFPFSRGQTLPPFKTIYIDAQIIKRSKIRVCYRKTLDEN